MGLFGAKLQFEAAMKYYKGVPKQGYSKNRQKAFMLCQEAARAGLVEAMVKLSEMYFNAEGCRYDEKMGENWLLRAAELEDAEALFRIGRVYLFSWKHKNKAWMGLEYLEKAAQQGHEEAMFVVGDYYVNHTMRLEKAIQYLGSPKLKYHPDAIYKLAKAHEGIERQASFAFESEEMDMSALYEATNYEEYMDAYTKLPPLYTPSVKVHQMYARALSLYEEKASFGSWRCALEAARMRLYGIGCANNPQKAFTTMVYIAQQEKGELSGDCAEHYREIAQAKLAKMYLLGIGCTKDEEKSKYYQNLVRCSDETLKQMVL